MGQHIKPVAVGGAGTIWTPRACQSDLLPRNEHPRRCAITIRRNLVEAELEENICMSLNTARARGEQWLYG